MPKKLTGLSPSRGWPLVQCRKGIGPGTNPALAVSKVDRV